jgi:hypothetical protein
VTCYISFFNLLLHTLNPIFLIRERFPTTRTQSPYSGLHCKRALSRQQKHPHLDNNRHTRQLPRQNTTDRTSDYPNQHQSATLPT